MPINNTCELESSVKIPYPQLVNLYGCRIGKGSFVGPFVEIQNDVTVGERCRIQSHTFICSGLTIGNDVFIGHGVIFINDRVPKANNEDWSIERTIVEDDVSIGSGATIMCGIRLARNCMIGAGAVVTKDVGSGVVVVGNPARQLEKR